MASSLIDETAPPEQGLNLMEAWDLDFAPTPARYIDKLLVDTEKQITALEQAAAKSGATSSADRSTSRSGSSRATG